MSLWREIQTTWMQCWFHTFYDSLYLYKLIGHPNNLTKFYKEMFLCFIKFFMNLTENILVSLLFNPRDKQLGWSVSFDWNLQQWTWFLTLKLPKEEEGSLSSITLQASILWCFIEISVYVYSFWYYHQI